MTSGEHTTAVRDVIEDKLDGYVRSAEGDVHKARLRRVTSLANFGFYAAAALFAAEFFGIVSETARYAIAVQVLMIGTFAAAILGWVGAYVVYLKNRSTTVETFE